MPSSFSRVIVFITSWTIFGARPWLGSSKSTSPGAPTSAKPESLAVNLDPAESELSAMDPAELVAAVTGHATRSAEQGAAPQEMTREEAERRQSLWWYLMLTGLLLLAIETVISNQLSRKEKFL